MATCAKCGAQVFQVLSAASLVPVLVDANPDSRLGMLKVDFLNKTSRVLSIAERETAIRSSEDLYTNHLSTCTAAERDRSYADDIERMVG